MNVVGRTAVADTLTMLTPLALSVVTFTTGPVTEVVPIHPVGKFARKIDVAS